MLAQVEFSVARGASFKRKAVMFWTPYAWEPRPVQVLDLTLPQQASCGASERRGEQPDTLFSLCLVTMASSTPFFTQTTLLSCLILRSHPFVTLIEHYRRHLENNSFCPPLGASGLVYKRAPLLYGRPSIHSYIHTRNHHSINKYNFEDFRGK